MRGLVVVVFVASFAISGCVAVTSEGLDTSGSVTIPKGKAVVVVGLSVPAESGTNITKISPYDPASMAADPNKPLVELRCRPNILVACKANTKKVIIVPPGDYVFENSRPDHRSLDFSPFVNYGEWRSGCSVSSCWHVFFSAKVLDTTPRFSVKEGEVVYIGDMVIPFPGRESEGFSQVNDEAGARAALGNSGLAEHMVVRLFEPAKTVPLEFNVQRRY